MNNLSDDRANDPSHRGDPHDSEALDELLTRDWLQAPPDFTRRVMQRLPSQSGPAASPGPSHAGWRRLRWILAATGLVGSGVLGLSQLAGFVFGLWLTSSAI